MSDIDRVFARLGGGQSAGTSQRETRRVPLRGGAAGSRVVEVVRLPARGAAAAPDQVQDQRPTPKLRAQSWDGGFPVRSAALPPAEPQPEPAEAAQPVAHVMPRWERTGAEPGSEATAPVAPPPVQPAGSAAPKPARHVAGPARRRVADPFDATDDAANCLRCGYVVEAARERRGLMTCAACG